METKQPIDLSGFISLLREIFAIVGHSPEDTEKHVKTFAQTVLILTMEKALSTLPAEKQEAIQQQMAGTDPNSQDQSSKVLAIVTESIPAATLESSFDEVSESLLTRYFMSIQSKLSDEQKQAIQKKLEE